MLLSPLEMLLHTRMVGEVSKFRRKKQYPVLYPTVFPFHPALFFPCGPSSCTWGTRGTHKGFKVPTGLSEDKVEPRQGLLGELSWCGHFGGKPHRRSYPWLGSTCFFELIISTCYIVLWHFKALCKH